MSHAHDLPDGLVIRNLADFDARSGTLPERILFNNRLVIVVLCALVSLVLGYQALGLSLNAAFEKMIPTKHPYIVNFLENRGQLAGMGNSLRIAVEAKEGDIFDPDYLDTVKKISDELFLYPGVDRPYMKSLWTPSVRWTGVTEEGLDGGPVVPDDYDGSPGKPGPGAPQRGALRRDRPAGGRQLQVQHRAGAPAGQGGRDWRAHRLP
jgi:hypothetical protein